MILKLPTLTREEATALGYVAISVVFAPAEEPDVAASMERTMAGIDAVWITKQHPYRTVAALGRKSNEVNLTLTEGHARNNWTQPDAKLRL